MRPVLLLLSLTLVATQTTSCAYAQWDIEESHTTASLRGIHNVGGGVAWASGTDGTVLRTEDGGYLWQTCAIPPGAEKLDFRGVQAFDENTAIVMSSGTGDQSRLYKTTDGCQTWKLVFTNPDKEGFWDALVFSDTKHGFLLGDPVLAEGKSKRYALEQTFDGGESWTAWQQKANGLAADENTSAFAASNSALVLEDRFSAVFATGGKGGSSLKYVSVHGDGICTCSPMQSEKVWNNQIGLLTTGVAPFPKAESGGIFSIAMNQHSIIAVGGDYLHPDSADGSAAHVARGGHRDLEAAQTPPHGYRSAVAYDANQKLWITVGPNGTDISTDDGKNWRPLTPSATDPADADKNWNALSLPFVVGPHGRIGRLRTIDQKPAATKKP
jgi:hypothetical protein